MPASTNVGPDAAVAEPLVERHGRELRVAPEARLMLLARDLVQALHDRAADAAAPMRRDDGDAADLAAVVEIESARADGRVAVEREHVPAERVAVVELELARHALLVDEHRRAHVADAREVGGEIGVADAHGSLVSSSRSRAAARGLRRARGRARRPPSARACGRPRDRARCRRRRAPRRRPRLRA